IDAPEGQEWRSATTWPLPGVTPTDFFFHRGRSGTSASFNDGILSRERPADPESADSRTIDTTATLGPANRWANTYGRETGYPDLAANDAKGFTWTSEPLAEPLEVIGHPIVHL